MDLTIQDYNITLPWLTNNEILVKITKTKSKGRTKLQTKLFTVSLSLSLSLTVLLVLESWIIKYEIGVKFKLTKWEIYTNSWRVCS